MSMVEISITALPPYPHGRIQEIWNGGGGGGGGGGGSL